MFFFFVKDRSSSWDEQEWLDILKAREYLISLMPV
jgi:hypothetical protein